MRVEREAFMKGTSQEGVGYQCDHDCKVQWMAYMKMSQWNLLCIR